MPSGAGRTATRRAPTPPPSRDTRGVQLGGGVSREGTGADVGHPGQVGGDAAVDLRAPRVVHAVSWAIIAARRSPIGQCPTVSIHGHDQPRTARRTGRRSAPLESPQVHPSLLPAQQPARYMRLRRGPHRRPAAAGPGLGDSPADTGPGASAFISGQYRTYFYFGGPGSFLKIFTIIRPIYLQTRTDHPATADTRSRRRTDPSLRPFVSPGCGATGGRTPPVGRAAAATPRPRG